jgi:rubrerythrin
MKIIDFARNMDRSAQHYYEGLAEKAGQIGPQRIFNMLAHDEEALLARLQRIQERMGARADLDSRALDGRVNVFQRLQRRERPVVTDDIDAYHLALEAERQVLRQYEQALANETEPEARRLLQRIADQERHELEEIEHLYAFTNAPQQYLEWGEFSNLSEFHNFGRDVDMT